MFQKRQKVNIDDTRFIFQTNFSGDPTRDRFGSDKRRVNIVIPTVEQAMDMKAMGINVKETHPNPNYTYDEPFVPTYYVPVTVNVDSKWPPHVYWITLQGKRLLCTPETIGHSPHILCRNIILLVKESVPQILAVYGTIAVHLIVRNELRIV